MDQSSADAIRPASPVDFKLHHYRFEQGVAERNPRVYRFDKMTSASIRFSFTFRYWRSFWSPEAATAE